MKLTAETSTQLSERRETFTFTRARIPASSAPTEGLRRSWCGVDCRESDQGARAHNPASSAPVRPLSRS
jgi:hypothetical protein